MTMLKNITEEGLRHVMSENRFDYEVGKVPTPHHFDPSLETGTFTAFRKDRPMEKPFATGLSSRWEPIQNYDAFRCLIGLSGKATLETLHILKGGAEVVAQVSLGDIPVGSGGDMVGKYLSLINTHDGTGSLLNLITPKRFFCDNQINSALQLARNQEKRESNVMMRIQHSASASDRIDQLIQSVSIANGEFDRSEELYNKMYDTTFDETYVWDVLKHLFPLKTDATDRSKTIWTNKLEDISQRFESADQGRTPKNTAWNLYNAIQGNLQHYGGNPESRFRNALSGSVSNKSAEAMTAVLDITSSENISDALKSEIDELTN